MAQYFLGIELGSTRIKAVLLNAERQIVKTGDCTWKSELEHGVWTYPMDAVQAGLQTALGNLGALPGEISAMGISGMMHGYLAFDKDWNLLAPFRTWQNTMTGEAADRLTEAFGFNIPQRWSVAHLYQAVLNGEAHVRSIAHITTLAGYVHHLLTGENAVGVGEASGMWDTEPARSPFSLNTASHMPMPLSGVDTACVSFTPAPRRRSRASRPSESSSSIVTNSTPAPKLAMFSATLRATPPWVMSTLPRFVPTASYLKKGKPLMSRKTTPTTTISIVHPSLCKYIVHSYNKYTTPGRLRQRTDDAFA